MTKFDSAKMEKLVAALVVVLYVAIQSFGATAPLFPADDANELFLVRTFGDGAWWRWLGPDAFGLFRPVKNLLFMLFDWMLPWGGVVSCRAVAIAVGVLSFFPVRTFCRRIVGPWTAIAVSAIWLLSPTLVSSVSWLSCLNIQVMAAFSALVLVFHDQNRPLCAALFLVAAQCSYESAVAAGPVVVAFDFFLRPERFRTRKAWGRYVFYAGLTVAYLVVRTLAGSAGGLHGSLAGASRLEVAFASAYFTFTHLSIWLWPFGRMAAFGSYVRGEVPFAGLCLCWLLVASMAAAALGLRRRRPLLAFGIAMFLIAFLPTSNILGFGNGPYGDYYLGFASIGLALAVVDATSWPAGSLGKHPVALFALLAPVSCWRMGAAVEAARWASLWRDGWSVCMAGVRTFPNSFSNRHLLAKLAIDANRYEEALAICAEIEAILPPGSDHLALVYMVRALAALNVDRDPDRAFDALDRMREVAREGSSEFYYHHYRGCVFDDLFNDVASAEREYVAALSCKERVDSVPTYDRLARLKAICGELNEAVGLWRRAIQLDPYNVAVILNLSTALRQSGDQKGADELKSRAMSLAGGMKQ